MRSPGQLLCFFSLGKEDIFLQRKPPLTASADGALSPGEYPGRWNGDFLRGHRKDGAETGGTLPLAGPKEIKDQYEAMRISPLAGLPVTRMQLNQTHNR